MLTYIHSFLPKISNVIYRFIFLFAFVSTVSSATANESGFALHFGVNAFYSYTHPGEIDLNVSYLVDLYLENQQATPDDLNYVNFIEFDIFFLVDDAYFDWDMDRVNIFPAFSSLDSYADIQSIFIFDGNDYYEGFRVLIHDPIGFFNEIRLWSEASASGTPVAVVEAYPSENYVIGACGTEDIYYNECRTVSPIMTNGRVVFYNGNSVDLGASLPSDTTCELYVYFLCDTAMPDDIPTGSGVVLKNEEEAHRLLDVQVFPNPTSDRLFIDVKNSGKGNVQFELFNQLGHRVMNIIQSDNKRNQVFDVRVFNPGLYVLRISDASGKQIYSSKVIIQR